MYLLVLFTMKHRGTFLVFFLFGCGAAFGRSQQNGEEKNENQQGKQGQEQEEQVQAPDPVGNSNTDSNSTSSVGYGIYNPEWAKMGIGGQLAKEGQFPYVVSLKIDKGRGIVGYCGGGLISLPKKGRTVYAVLSAAHCFKNVPSNGKVEITMGTANIKKMSSTAKTVTVAIGNVVSHPQYTQEPPINDIAVIRLASNFKLSRGISTLPLPEAGDAKSDWSGIPIIFAGWGRNNDYDEVKNPQQVYFTTDTMTDRECADARKRSNVADHLICLDGTDMKGSCRGDSGGPVAWRNEQDKPLQIIGVSSFRLTKTCGGHTPTYHTRVAYYVKWINQNV